ncbi:hypothetical protein TNCV_3357761 [Trichonephila clavipes]|nr:hypothetical protein TNCV_3357761 [Trichonephila clavipes]
MVTPKRAHIELQVSPLVATTEQLWFRASGPLDTEIRFLTPLEPQFEIVENSKILYALNETKTQKYFRGGMQKNQPIIAFIGGLNDSSNAAFQTFDHTLKG